jgi:hypothetical protein
MKQTLALAALLISSLALADHDKKYTLADLKALVEQKSYQEAIEHLADVAPSERNADWQDVAGKAAVGLLDGAPDAITKLQYMIGIEQQYPAVMKSPKYVAARTEAAGPAFNACFDQGDFMTCKDYAKKFVDADPTNGKLTLSVAKAVRHGMSSYSATPFFKKAIAANKQSSICKDEDLEIAVIASMGLPEKDELYNDGRAILKDSCFAELKKPALEELAKEESGYYHDNVCALMTEKKENVAKLCAKK